MFSLNLSLQSATCLTDGLTVLKVFSFCSHLLYTCLAVGGFATAYVSAKPSQFEWNAGLWHKRTAGQHNYRPRRDHQSIVAMSEPVISSRSGCHATGARQMPVCNNSAFCLRHTISYLPRASAPQRVQPWRHLCQRYHDYSVSMVLFSAIKRS